MTPTFLCGHPKDGNSMPNGTRMRCAICTKASTKARAPQIKQPTRQPSANPYPNGHPSIALYEAEKAKREALKEPAITAARRAFFAQLDAEKLARRQQGGRPRKSA